MRTRVSPTTIEAGPAELEALRVALCRVAHSNRCAPVLAAAREGRIVADDFVLGLVCAARERLADTMLEHRRDWPPSAIAHTSRRVAKLERLQAVLESVTAGAQPPAPSVAPAGERP
jgi:hypothetical protein